MAQGATNEMRDAIDLVCGMLHRLAKSDTGESVADKPQAAKAQPPVEDEPPEMSADDLRDKARNLLKTIADLGGGAAPAKALLKKVTGELKLSLVEDKDLPNLVSAAETELAEKQAA